MCIPRWSFALLLAIAVLLPTSAKAQTYTAVSGTVLDPNGLPYSGALITFSLTAHSGQATITPCVVSPCPVHVPGTAQADATGKFTVTLLANGSMLPAGIQWVIGVTEPGVPLPWGTGPQQFTYTFTASGSSMDLSAAMSALAPALTQPFPSGGGGGSSGAIVVCLSTQSGCKYPINGNGRRAHYATFTSGSPLIATASTDPPFVCPGGVFPCSTGGDVGDVEYGTYGCGAVNPAQCTAGVPYGTILSIQDAHDATVSVNAIHNSGTNNPGGVPGNNFYWGSLDDTGLAAAWAVLTGIPGGGTLELPCYNILVSKMPFNRTGAEVTAGSIGNITINQCPYGKILPVPPGSPGFDLTTCNNGCIFYDASTTGNSQPADTPRIELQGFNVDGAGWDCASCSLPSNAKGIVYLLDSEGANVSLSGWVWDNAAYFPGLTGAETSWYVNSTSYMAGDPTCGPSSTSTTLYLSNDLCNGYHYGEQVAANQVLKTSNSFFFDNDGLGRAIYQTGGILESSNDQSNSMQTNAGTAWLSTDYLPGSAGADGVNVRGGLVHLQNTNVNGPNGVNVGFSSSGGSIFDDCGNTINTATIYTSGLWFGSCSTTGTAQTAANITPSTGWGTSGAAGNGVSAVSGDSHAEYFTVTAAGTPTANPKIAIVFPTSFWQGPHCQANEISSTGTNGFSDTIQSTLPTATGVTLTWEGTPVAGSTYTFAVTCQ